MRIETRTDAPPFSPAPLACQQACHCSLLWRRPALCGDVTMESYAAALWPRRFDLDGGGAEHMGLALIVHGGAGAMASDRFDAPRDDCRPAPSPGSGLPHPAASTYPYTS